MKWFSPRKNSLVALQPVTLSQDEKGECEALLRSLIESEEGQLHMPAELVDSFKRSVIARCLMGRAERFLILAENEPEYGEQACQAAAKACAMFPLSICFYDFACTLSHVGRHTDAKVMFQEFLSRITSEDLDPVMESTLRARDVAEAIQHAQSQI